MKRLGLLCFAALAVSLLGCQPQKTHPELSKEQYSYVSDKVLDVSVSELSKIVTSLCEELGITIQETIEDIERYEYNCTSLSNRNIRIQLEALVKGRSNTRVAVQGDKRIAASLGNDILYRLRSAVDDYRRN